MKTKTFMKAMKTLPIVQAFKEELILDIEGMTTELADLINKTEELCPELPVLVHLYVALKHLENALEEGA